ncbi:MAG: glycerol-3-phosphate dehydrogenase/oxidase [Gammaproteobacteria bacterium]|nr:glycerol-3-phosphate dehydrogenase/oxidase [Gammaproteobacteria bacterium]
MNTEPQYDVAIIGAGVNGAGIARDAALRGLRVVVLEQNDMCSGTSAYSSRLIHGGLRYLEYGEIPLVYESLHERRHLRDIAPHLVAPIRIGIPIYEGARRGPLLIRLGMLAYDLLSLGKRMPRHEMLSRNALLSEAPGLESDGLRGGARYFDAQVTFVERLVLENLLAARAAGADVMTYHRVTGIPIENGQVDGIEYENMRSGATGKLQTKLVVNASGPWVDQVIGVAADDAPQLVGGTKGSHIIVSRFDGAPDDAFYVEAESDGRPFFVIPWNGMILIGTTDIRSDEPLEALRASGAEIDYLVSETNRVFPSAALKREGIHYAYAGVRPLPHRKEGPESAITRKHIILKNEAVASGLVSIIGGKLTTYRHLAEQAVDLVEKMLRRRRSQCRTHDTPLPGGRGLDEAREALTRLGLLSDSGIERVISIYGGRARQLAELCEQETRLAHCIDDDRTILGAEVAFAIRDEMALTLSDIVHRRLMIGFDADQGEAHYEAIARLAAVEFEWSDRQQEEELEALVSYSHSFRVGQNE